MSMTTLAARLQYAGGDQLGRINKQKLNSLKAALKNDYNSRVIKTPLRGAWSCLINSDNLKPDYDKKYISIEFDSGLEAGDVFEVLEDNTRWMIYLPVLTETAYLRAEIIRCRYQLFVDGEQYWVYFQGPTETTLEWRTKHNINVNNLNLSGTVYIKNTPATKKYFSRFKKIKLDGHTWEVQVVDSISVPGIIELEVQEYYDNSIQELPPVIVDKDKETLIVGKTAVKPGEIVGYAVDDSIINSNDSWSIIDGTNRVKIVEVLDDGRICKVEIPKGSVKPFIVQYGSHSLNVTIDWKKSMIIGPELVYPYDFCKYSIDTSGIEPLSSEKSVVFSSDSNLVKVTNTIEGQCEVEILTGKSGQFILNCYDGDELIESLPVKIGSL